jgi:hypothetical protein
MSTMNQNDNDVEYGRDGDKPKLSTKASSATVDANSSSDDPFADREGKTLLWRGVKMTLVRVYIKS